MNQPLLSIVVPVYNVEPYLRRCLDSLVNQTLKDIEIIVINDCSPANEQVIIEEYMQKDPRVKSIIHEKNKGAGMTKNTGIQVAKGKYLAFVDSDDWVELNAYEDLCHLAEKEKVDVVSFGFFYHKQNKKEIHAGSAFHLSRISAISSYLKHDIPMIACSKIYRKNIIDQGKIFFSDFFYDDLVFVFQVLCEANSFVQIKNCFYNYYARANSTTHILSNKAIEDYAKGLNQFEFLCQKYQLHEFQKELDDYIQDMTGYYYKNILTKNIQTLSLEQQREKLSIFAEIFGKHAFFAAYNSVNQDSSYLWFGNFARVVNYFRAHGLKHTLQKIILKLKK